MKSILLSTLALGAMTAVAAAGPVPLTGAQMDSVTAGKITQHTSNPAGNEPPGQQDKTPNNPKFTTENQNPQGKAPPGQN